MRNHSNNNGRLLNVREICGLLRTPRREVESLIASAHLMPVESSRYSLLEIEAAMQKQAREVGGSVDAPRAFVSRCSEAGIPAHGLARFALTSIASSEIFEELAREFKAQQQQPAG